MPINAQIPLSAGAAGAARVDSRIPNTVDARIPLATKEFKPVDFNEEQIKNIRVADGMEQFRENQAVRLESQRVREEKERDRIILEQYQQTGGDLYSADGMEIALKELAPKLSPESMQGYQKLLSTRKDSEIKTRTALAKLKDEELDVYKAMQEETTRVLNRALTVYDDALKETQDPAKATEAYDAAKAALIESTKSAVSPVTGKPLFSPQELDKFAKLPPESLRAVVKDTKWRAEQIKEESLARLRESRVDNTDSLIAQRAAKAEAAAKALASGGDMTEDALSTMAEYVRVSGPGVLGRFGLKGPQRVAVLERVASLNRGEDVTAREGAVEVGNIKAQQKSIEKMVSQLDNITAFEKTAENIGNKLVEIAKKVDDTGVPVIERWTRAGKRAITGDTDVIEFNTRMQTFRTEMARIITQPNLTGVLSDTARKEIEEILPNASSAEQVERGVEVLINEAQARRKYLVEQIEKGKASVKQGAKKDAPATVETTAEPSFTVAPAVQKARDGGRLQILQQELDAKLGEVSRATDPTAKARLQGDVEALQREIAGTEKKVGAKPAAKKVTISNWGS